MSEQSSSEEMLRLYGDLPLKFSSYYKYTFTYSAIAPDGSRIVAGYGGSGDDIYRYEVSPEKTITLNQAHEWSFAIVKRDGVQIWSEMK